MVRRYELTPKQFALIKDLLPARGKRGGRWNDHHTKASNWLSKMSTMASESGSPKVRGRTPMPGG